MSDQSDPAGEGPSADASDVESAAEGRPVRGPRAPKPPPAPTYRCETAGVEVAVEPMFLESQSFPALDHFVWAYRVTIQNHRDESIRLTDRFWRLTDKHGAVREVEGAGVVGETPVIRPGSSYVYTSGAPLPTPSGVMGGRYGMEASDGVRFDVEIPTFSLDSPHDKRTLN